MEHTWKTKNSLDIDTLISLYKISNYDEVIKISNKLLLSRPDDAGILNLLGSSQLKKNNLQSAITAFKKALILQPDNASLYVKLSAALINLGQIDLALKNLKIARDFDADNKDIKYNMAACYMKQRMYEDAIFEYQEIIKIDPSDNNARSYLGIALQQLGKYKESIKEFLKVINNDPRNVTANISLAISLRHIGRTEDSISLLYNAATSTTDKFKVYLNLGILLKDEERYEEALKVLEEASHVDSEKSEIFLNQGEIFQKLGDHLKSVEKYRKAISLSPQNSIAYNNLGVALVSLGKTREAISAYTKALEINPDFSDAKYNLGNAQKSLGQISEAIESFSKTIEINPYHYDALYNLGITHLLAGNIREGFKLHEWRFSCSTLDLRKPNASKAWRLDQELDGKKFLVFEEQGIGDILQFCRFVPNLATRGASVTFLVRQSLHHLMNLGDGIVLKDRIDIEDDFDFDASLMSLPYLLGIDNSYGDTCTPYLRINEENQKIWKRRLSSNKFRIGVCWQGSTTRVDLGRSFHLSRFKAVSKIKNVELVSLHKGAGEDQLNNIDFPIINFTDEIDNGKNAFIDTAAIMMSCDLVITSDTAIAHLAGALNRPTWVLLKFIPDWRWGLEDHSSSWYKSMRLYRQKEPNHWESVFSEIETDLKHLLQVQNYEIS